MPMTTKDIARIAGVSQATVSRSLNNSPLISEGTRRRILDIALEQGFEFNASARSLSTNSSGTIGVIYPDNYSAFNLYLSSLHDQLRSVLEREEYDLIVTFEKNQQTGTSHIRKLILSRKIDGLIIVKPELDADTLAFLRKHQVPFVMLHHCCNTPGLSNTNRVYTDHFRGGYLAAEYLVKLGHKKILTVSARGIDNEYALRTEGYKAALSDCKIPFDPADILYGDASFQSGYQVVRDNQARLAGVGAIFAQSDLMALGIKEALGEMGLRVPQDVSLVGYDDIELCTMMKPWLTTIHQPKEESAKLACELLVELIGSQGTDSREIRVSPTLVIRQSCSSL